MTNATETKAVDSTPSQLAKSYQIPSTLLLTKDERNNLEALLEAIYEVTGIPPGLFMESRSQKSKYVYLRQIAAYVIRTYTKLTLREIGIMQAYRDHSSIIHSCKQVESWLDGAPGFAFEKKMTERIIKCYGEKCEAFI